MKYPKKLIEVALPLDDINEASAREKSIRHGHPSTLHLWWARRPLAAARAVLFAQMVNDPGGERGYQNTSPTQTKADAQLERDRLFDIIRDLVKWENTNNEEVLERARVEIRKSWAETCKITGEDPNKLPAFHDPFAGGGTIPLEAQRLGLESYASDLNPVAVLINKAMIEIPPKFAGRAPIGPTSVGEQERFEDRRAWPSATGLAEDVRRYGAWMRKEAIKRIGHLYPQVDLPKKYGGGKATVIAWLWARTVKSPNPAYAHVEVPLVSTFILSSKAGKEAYVHPVVEGDNYRFEMRTGKPPESAKGGTTAGKRSAFLCLLSGVPISYNYIREEGKANRIRQKLMAVVAEGSRGRIYLPPTEEMELLARSAQPKWKPEIKLPNNPRDFKTPNYGMRSFSDLFTPRQLVALTTFSDLVYEAREKVVLDALKVGLPDDKQGLNAGGTGATAYADALAVYLAFGIEKATDYNSTACSWISGGQTMRNTFGRQAIPMVWDFAEANIISSTTGSYASALDQIVRVINELPVNKLGIATQYDAQSQSISNGKLISTDPPYYDNIGYADLSDFFYVWLRRTLKSVFPELFVTMSVPKDEELIATPYRHGGKEAAESFFLDGMTKAMHRLAVQAHSVFPVTIYYAFKQSDTGEGGTVSTGWETFLEAVLQAGFAITGTWPMRTEMGNQDD